MPQQLPPDHLPPQLSPAPFAAALKEQQAELNAKWEAERDEMGKVQALKGEIDRVNIEIQVGAGRSTCVQRGCWPVNAPQHGCCRAPGQLQSTLAICGR